MPVLAPRLESAERTVSLTHASGKVQLLKGEDAMMQLQDPHFISEWDKLYDNCSWGTPFQSRRFVMPWYALFQEKHLPIVISQMQDDALVGLLTLTLSPGANLAFAGTDVAEYQVWLALPDKSDDFIQQALLEVSKAFPGKKLQLKHIPSGTPLAWATTDKGFKARCVVKEHKQPLMRIDYAALSAELRKKNRKEKVNRLKRLGNLQFLKITDPEEFDGILDELATQSDFRKGAMFDLCHFQNNPTRKKLLSDLFRQDLLHVTILKLDEKIIASNVGVAGRKWVHLQGINTHCPMHARYSPGILHFLMLGVMLSQEGIDVFDLTPGGDSYKDVLATDYTTAYELTYLGQSAYKFRKMAAELYQYSLQKLQEKGVSQAERRAFKKRFTLARQKLKLAMHLKLSPAVLPVLKAGLTTPTPTLRQVETQALPTAEAMPLRQNRLADLLLYNPKGSLRTRWEFLQNAMKRLEAGQVGYTWVAENQLLACVWVTVPHTSKPLSVDASLIPADAYVAEEVYAHPTMSDKKTAILQGIARVIETHAPQAGFYTLN